MDFRSWVDKTLTKTYHGKGVFTGSFGAEFEPFDEFLYFWEIVSQQGAKLSPEVLRRKLTHEGQEIRTLGRDVYENAREDYMKIPRDKRDRRLTSLRIYHLAGSAPLPLKDGNEWTCKVVNCYHDPKEDRTKDSRRKIHFDLRPLLPVKGYATKESIYRDRASRLVFRVSEYLVDGVVALRKILHTQSVDDYVSDTMHRSSVRANANALRVRILGLPLLPEVA